MYACVYVCIYVIMYVCIYVSVYVRAYNCVFQFDFVVMFTSETRSTGASRSIVPTCLTRKPDDATRKAKQN